MEHGCPLPKTVAQLGLVLGAAVVSGAFGRGHPCSLACASAAVNFDHTLVC
jgi:hypothetical protein